MSQAIDIGGYGMYGGHGTCECHNPLPVTASPSAAAVLLPREGQNKMSPHAHVGLLRTHYVYRWVKAHQSLRVLR